MGKTLVACVAVALLVGGGSAYAAKTITSKDIKNRTIKTVDLSRGAKKALKGNRGRTGPQGQAGPQGAAGPQGPAGPSVVGKIAYVERSFIVAAGDIDIQGVQCPPGHNIVSGGWTIISGAAVPFVDKSYSGSEWSVGVDNFDGMLSADATAHAWCAPAGAAVVASVGKRSIHNQRGRDERRQRAAH